MNFLILDVFAREKYAGNQLAVCFDAGELSPASMQAIAKEFNFPETTFILSDRERDGAWDVRIFTPNEEVPFAGHPTLGTSWAIADVLVGGRVEELTLHLKAGRIPVTFSYLDDGTTDLLWMRQLPPTFGDVLERAEAARLLSLDVDQVDAGFPAQVVSTGLPFLLVALKDLDAVRKARLDPPSYRRFLERGQAKAVYLFGRGGYRPDSDAAARLFADYYGIPEDPATGSACGCLAGYLAKHRYFGGPEVEATVDQGYEIGRPSALYLKSKDRGDEIEVRVGGRVIPVARGELI
jgi:trans-2,3-dihydro-3-hydroxyanthranilate isomerase